MDFYRDLSKYYEIIFPLNDDKLQLVKKHLKPGMKVLDIGCGTGELVIALEALGFHTAGMDLSVEMIEKAKEYATEKGLNSNFQVGDMREIGLLYQEQFDGILCFGNTIVHLNQVKEIGDFFQQVNNLLKPGGIFLFQIVNYDRILDKEIKELPVLKNDENGLIFYRHYDYDENSGLITFRTRLLIDSQEKIAHELTLYPLRLEEAKNHLYMAGFTKISIFGNFGAIPYEPANSQAMVVLAQKS